MAGTYRLQIVTQAGVKFDDRVESLRASGVEGWFGVRPGHAPMIAELSIGEVFTRKTGEAEREFCCGGGILEVTYEGVVVLADSIEEVCDIDLERARAAEERARERLRSHQPDTDIDRAEVALARAVNRLKVAAKMR